MTTRFHPAATQLNHPGIQRWKDSGRPVVGYSCSYVPVELFHAAGILPIRLRGIETDGMEIGDAWFGPYICSFPKCVLQLAGRRRLGMLDGVVITPGCDSMRRLDECWRMADEEIPGIAPAFFHYLDVPHKTVDHRIDWYADELKILRSKLEEHFQVKIEDAAIEASIHTYRQGRRLLAEMEVLRARVDPPLTGREAFAAAIAATVSVPEEYNDDLAAFLAELQTRSTDRYPNPPKRLMLIGSISDDIELVGLLEADGRAVVVADNLCFGARSATLTVAEGPDPVRSLAEAYLKASTCPRMFGRYQQRLELLKAKIESHRVDGVILQNIRFCDLHGSENGLIERDLERLGLPCLRLEREYGPLTETGRLKMRIEAFMERLG
jgi:benzoyl-CoA reductase subunit C